MKKLLAILLAVLTCASLSLVGCSATLNDWNAPTYANVNVGDTVFVQTVTATDTNNGIHTATVQVIGPKGAVAVNGQTFVASDAGNYSVVYEINGVQKVATFTAGSSNSGNNSGNNGGNNGGNSGNSGNSGNTGISEILGALTVTPSDDPCFEVSGNTVTVLKAVEKTEWQSVGWFSVSGWSMANGAKISITINNTSVQGLQLKYKFVDLNNSEAYDDIAWDSNTIAVGGSKTWTNNIGAYDIATPTGVKQIELFVAATSTGSFTVSAQLAGNSSSGGNNGGNNGITVGSGVLAYPDYEEHTKLVSVSGNTITIKQPTTGKYVEVCFSVSGWTALKGGNLSLKVESSISADVEVVAKVYTNGASDTVGQGAGVGWFPSDSSMIVPANGTKTFGPVPATTYDQQDATNVTKIGVMLLTSGTGNVTVTPIFN